MRTQKNNLISAQLVMHYQLYAETLFVNTAAEAVHLFKDFANSTGCFDGWYIIFLDKKSRFKCWQELENFCEIEQIAKDIASFGKTIGAKQIIMARLDNGKNTKGGYLDICWIADLLKSCDQRRITLKNYLVISQDNWCSYEDEIFIE